MHVPQRTIETALPEPERQASRSAVTLTAMPNEQRFEFDVGGGELRVTGSEPGGVWVVTFHPRPPELGAGGPWLSSSHPDMPTKGEDMERIARAIRDWWEALYPPHEGGA
jgi:hypothetical protein